MFTRPARPACLLPIMLGVVLPAPGAGQSLRVVAHRAAAGFTFDGMFRANDPGARSSNTAYTEWFVLPFSGSVLDSRILSYSFELRPRFVQNFATDLPESIRARDLGTSATLSLFSALPLSLETVYSRTAGITRGGFGTKGDFGTQALFSVLSFKNVYLPMNVSYSRRSRQNVTQVRADLNPVEIADRVQTLRVLARNSKLQVKVAWTDQMDRIGSNDFALREIDLGHRLRWGKGSTLESRADWSRRSGDSPYDRSSWNERLRIRHTRNTTTGWTLGRFRSEVLDATLVGTSLGGRLDSRALSWLTVGAGASRRTSETETGRRVTSFLGPRVAVRLPLPLGGSFSGNASGALVRRSLTGSLDNQLQVLNEEHQVDETFLVELVNPRVDPTSVAVRSEDQTIVYVEGVDHTILTVGSITQVRVLPGSRIEQGDRLLISYLFTPDGGLKENGLQTAFSAGLSLWGFSVRHSRSRRDSEVEGGTQLPIEGDFEEVATILAFRGRLPIGLFRASAWHRRREGGTINYVTDEAMVSLGVPAGRNAQIFLDANARRVEDETDAISVVAVGASTTLSFGSLSADVGLRLQDWRQRIGRDEVSVLAQGGLRWRVGRFDARARAHWDRRTMPGSATSGLRMRVDLTRRF